MEQDDLMTFRRKLVEKLSISTMEGFSLIRLNEILYLEADGNYTVMHLTNDKKVVSTKNLATPDELRTLEERLYRNYTCPHCEAKLGQWSWYHYAETGKCPSCKKSFKKTDS